jgi:type II pantothenate kinase
LLAAVDLGGTNVDVLVAEPDGTILHGSVHTWATVNSLADLARVLGAAGAAPERLSAVAVTGGRHRELPDTIAGAPLLHVNELQAIGRGGLLAAGVDRALIMSMGTGTAFVSAGPEGFAHLGGTAVGGGTVLGLARLTLGTTDPRRIGELAAAGNRHSVDLSVGDIIGGGVGMVPAEMTASHFGKVGRPAAEAAPADPADVAAGLLELVGQALGRMGGLAARAQDHDRIVLTGHLIEWPGIVAAVRRVTGLFGGNVIVPSDPGFATARGALAALLDETHR